MSKASILPFIFLALSSAVRASPPPPLSWATSRFSVPLQSGVVEFTMECPAGVLTRLTAVRATQVAHLAVERLAELSLSKTCSGVSTRASMKDEGSSEVAAIELTVELSHEYVVEQLWISFDLQSFRFIEAMRTFNHAGEKTQVTRVKFQ